MASRAEVIVASRPAPRDYIAIEADCFWMSWRLRRMTTKQIGRMVLKMVKDFGEGRDDAVIALPFVDHVKRYAPGREAVAPSLRADVLASGRCAACPSTHLLEVDHIVPWSRGGTNARDNLQPLCITCNRSKGARTMEEWRG